jgi:hypothetical protein
MASSRRVVVDIQNFTGNFRGVNHGTMEYTLPAPIRTPAATTRMRTTRIAGPIAGGVFCTGIDNTAIDYGTTIRDAVAKAITAARMAESAATSAAAAARDPTSFVQQHSVASWNGKTAASADGVTSFVSGPGGFCMINGMPVVGSVKLPQIASTPQVRFESNRIISEANCTVVGDHNHVTGMNARVHGDYNYVSGMDARVYGNWNFVSGMNASVYGNDCTVHGMNASCVGLRCTVDGVQSSYADHPIDPSQFPPPPRPEAKEKREPLPTPSPPSHTDDDDDQDYEVRLSLPPSTKKKCEDHESENSPPHTHPAPSVHSDHDDSVFDTKMGEDTKAKEKEKGGQACVICLENDAKLAPAECGHLSLCFKCAKTLLTKHDDEPIRCPLCKKEMRQKMISIILPH